MDRDLCDGELDVCYGVTFLHKDFCDEELDVCYRVTLPSCFGVGLTYFYV